MLDVIQHPDILSRTVVRTSSSNESRNLAWIPGRARDDGDGGGADGFGSRDDSVVAELRVQPIRNPHHKSQPKSAIEQIKKPLRVAGCELRVQKRGDNE
jgi:hypothetical protein